MPSAVEQRNHNPRVVGSTPTAATNGGYPNNPVLAGNILNPYSPEDSVDTGENGKDQAGTSSAAIQRLNSAAIQRRLLTPFKMPSLQVVIAAWPHLGPDAKRRIMAIIRTEDEKARSRQTLPSDGM